MRRSRLTLLLLSTAVVLLLVGGGLGLRVGASDGSYRQVVLFSEILSLVLDNYVDPVETGRLLEGAYEGMLGGLDSHGAYLTPDEVLEWKRARGLTAHPGLELLKVFGTIQIVRVDGGSPADLAGIVPGDQLRSIDGRAVRELSLDQVSGLLRGEPGSEVTVVLLHAARNLERRELTLRRVLPQGPPFGLEELDGIALLRVHDLARVDAEDLRSRLAETRDSGVEKLLIDLRNDVDGETRHAAALAGLLAPGGRLELRDRSGRVLESIELADGTPAWPGPLAVLVNGFTAGAAEAVALLLKERGAPVYGESTFGLGAEPRLFELPDGSGLVVSAAVWKIAPDRAWNGDGIDPDHRIEYEGNDFVQALADQLRRALELFRATPSEPPAKKAA